MKIAKLENFLLIYNKEIFREKILSFDIIRFYGVSEMLSFHTKATTSQTLIEQIQENFSSVLTTKIHKIKKKLFLFPIAFYSQD